MLLNAEDNGVLVFRDEEAACWADAIRGIKYHPYADFERFHRAAAESLHLAAPRAHSELMRFARAGNSDGVLMLRNLPREWALPATPTLSGIRATTATWTSEAVMCGVASVLGEPVAYGQERGGHIFHDVYPTLRNAKNLSSESSAHMLDFHTEMVFHPFAPDYLLLNGLRQDPAKSALTLFSGTRRFLGEIPRTMREALFKAEYSIELGRLHSSYLAFGRPVKEKPVARPNVPILYGDFDDPFLRFEPELMTCRTAEAEAALHALERAVKAAHRAVSIEPGSLMVLDNRRCAHARSEFVANFDGADRWLRRMLVVQDLNPSHRDRAPGSRVIKTDLGTGWSGFHSVAQTDA